MVSRSIGWVALVTMCAASACGGSDPKDRCTGSSCDAAAGGSAGGGAGGTGGDPGTGGSGGDGGIDERWLSPLAACEGDFLSRARIDPHASVPHVGEGPALPDGFEGVMTLGDVNGERTRIALHSDTTGIAIYWPRPLEQISPEYVGKEYMVTRHGGWLTLRPVDLATMGDIVSVLYRRTGRNPPARIESPLPGVGPTFEVQPQCTFVDAACAEQAIQLEVHLDGKDPMTTWSGWVGGIANWNLSQWSKIQTGDCAEGYSILIAGEGYLFMSP